MNKHNHPPQPYDHNLTKICKIDGCGKLGYIVTCGICKKPKRKTRCELHLMEHKEMNRIYRGKLSAEFSSLKELGRHVNNSPTTNEVQE